MNLQNAMKEISRTLGLSGSYTHDDVIRELRSKHQRLISQESEKLENMGLKRILSHIDGGSKKGSDPAQGDLFSQIENIPRSFDAKALGIDKKRGMRIWRENIPLDTLRAFISGAEKPREIISRSEQIKKTILKILELHADPSDKTFGDVLKKLEPKP